MPIHWTKLRYPGDDPENGPARRNPIGGCVKCGSKNAENYTIDGVCSMCSSDEVNDYTGEPYNE